MQLFVGKVDTQLLEAVVVEFLKAENIQNACKCKTGGRQVREGREEGRERAREEGREGREEREGEGEGRNHWNIQSLSFGHRAL